MFVNLAIHYPRPDKEALLLEAMGRLGKAVQNQPGLRYMHAHKEAEHLPQTRRVRERSYDLLALHQGATVIDVGCGTGRVVAELTERGITAIGLDSSEQMIGVARQRFPYHDFRLAAAESLPFEACSLHGYRAERVYQHLKDPGLALIEARRVLASGGRIVLVDQDAEMWAIDSDDEETTRALARAFSDSITNPWIGRCYHGLLLDAGFVEVAVEVRTLLYTDWAQASLVLSSVVNAGVAAGVVARDQAHAWLAEQERRGQAERFFLAMPLFLASAHQP